MYVFQQFVIFLLPQFFCALSLLSVLQLLIGNWIIWGHPFSPLQLDSKNGHYDVVKQENQTLATDEARGANGILPPVHCWHRGRTSHLARGAAKASDVTKIKDKPSSIKKSTIKTSFVLREGAALHWLPFHAQCPPCSPQFKPQSILKYRRIWIF